MSRFRRISVAIAVVALGLVGLYAPAPAQAASACEFEGRMVIDPGLNVLPPSATASYDLATSVFLCQGDVTTISTFFSDGTINGSFAFSGRFFIANGCAGWMTGSITGAVLTGTINSECGSGPIAAAAVPFADLNGVVLSYELAGAIVLQ